MEILNWAIDIIDERDFIYENQERAWNVEIKDYVVNDNWEIQDQNKAGYKMWCVYFSSSMHDNYLNNRDKIQDRTTWPELCKESKTRSSENWDAIKNWPKLLQDKKLIEWFFQITTLNWMLEVLSNWNLIHTGSNKINRVKTFKTNIADFSWWPGHCTHIIGYNNSWTNKKYNTVTIPDKYFIFKNSSILYPYFLVSFDNVDKLFSKYYFENNKQIILDYKQKIMDNIKLESAKKFFERWYTNWLNPQEPITREEAWALLERIIDKNNLK